MNLESNNQEIKQDKIVESDQGSVAHDPLVGSLLGTHLKILSCIGFGGMSVVYKAEDQLLNRTVAVKLLHSHSALNPQNVLRFRQEAMAASKIDHLNVIRVYEFNVPDQGQPYLVMDFIEGLSLADFIQQNGPIEMRRAISLMAIICDGLQCAHDAGVIHRDLKPGNIMLLKDLSGRQTLKIVDFGIAKLLTENAEGHALTQTGEVFGSPLYMSPEQCYGKTLDNRSDLYSIGCVLYEMCTGQPPIKGNSLLETIQLQVTEMPQPAESKYPGIKYGAAFDQVIATAMAKDPDERFQSATEFKNALLQLPNATSPTHKTRNAHLEKVFAIGGAVAVTAIVLASPLVLNKFKTTEHVIPQSATQIVTQSTSSDSAVVAPPPQKSIDDTEKRTTDSGLRELYLQGPKERQPAALDIADSEVSDEALKVIANNEKLRTIRAPRSHLSDRSGATIASLPNLEKLDVSGTKIGNSFIKSICASKHLWYLWCQNTKITDAGLEDLAQLPLLHQLSLSETRVTDAGLPKLASLKLTELRLTKSAITGSGLKSLANMRSLIKLFVGKNNIGNEGVAYLKNLTGITFLSIESAGLTDQGVKPLSAFTNLEYLNLNGNNFSSKSLQYLSELPHLKILHIAKCHIPDNDISSFRKSHPDMRINEK